MLMGNDVPHFHLDFRHEIIKDDKVRGKRLGFPYLRTFSSSSFKPTYQSPLLQKVEAMPPRKHKTEAATLRPQKLAKSDDPAKFMNGNTPSDVSNVEIQEEVGDQPYKAMHCPSTCSVGFVSRHEAQRESCIDC